MSVISGGALWLVRTKSSIEFSKKIFLERENFFNQYGHLVRSTMMKPRRSRNRIWHPSFHRSRWKKPLRQKWERTINNRNFYFISSDDDDDDVNDSNDDDNDDKKRFGWMRDRLQTRRRKSKKVFLCLLSSPSPAKKNTFGSRIMNSA